MQRRFNRMIAMIVSIALIMSINHIETVFGIVPNAMELLTIQLDEQIELYLAKKNQKDADPALVSNEKESFIEETTSTISDPGDFSEKEFVEEEGIQEEYIEETAKEFYAPGKTTVAAQQAINYTNYDAINIGVYNHKDWQCLTAITHKTNLEGVTVIISNDGDKTSDKQNWNLTLGDLTYKDEENQVYYGLGSEQYPFAGNMISQFNLTINPKVPLFTYLSSKATIGSSSYSITLNYPDSNNDVNAGLARHLILESDNYMYSYTKLIIKGYIGKGNGTSEVAGGLFADVCVKPDAGVNGKFLINSKMSSLETITRVCGKTAGGIVGELQPGVTVEMSACPVLPTKVQSTANCAGGVIGKIQHGTAFKTSGTSASIGLKHGVATNNSAFKTIGKGYVGGLIGWVQDATVQVSNIKKEDSVSGTVYVGGLIGFVQSTSVSMPVTVNVSNFTLAAFHIAQTENTSTTSYCVGGVIGKYQTAENDINSKLEITTVISDKVSRENTNAKSSFPRIESPNIVNKEEFFFNGGIVGGIYGNNVKISDIEFEPDRYKISQVTNINGESSTFAANTKTVGSVAGAIVGTNISIENIVLGLEKNYTGANDYYYVNGISGSVIGGIVGKVGYFDNKSITGTKLKVNNIKVKSYSIWSAAKVSGGLFGDVGKGSLVSLGGELDLTGLVKNNATATTYTDLLGNLESRGFVAGKVTEGLVYFEPNAVVTRPITVDEEGEIYFSTEATGSASTKDINYYSYTISDVGNYGSIFQNVMGEDGEPVIQFDNEAGTEVTGVVTTTTYMDGKTYYVIDSIADALRLAIAGHTFDLAGDDKLLRFAKSCFSVDSVLDILQSNFLLQCDLNLQEAGIHGFLRNDTTILDKNIGFSGILRGDIKNEDEKYTITLFDLTRQYYGGLFSNLSSGVQFNNLIINGYLGYQRARTTTNAKSEGAAGSLAANHTGDITIINIDIQTKMKGCYVSNTWANETMYSFGGAVGTVNLSGGKVYVEGGTIRPELKKMHAHNFVGGLFGTVRTLNVGNTIIVKNSVISTQYIADKYFSHNNVNHSHHVRMAGLIGFIGHSHWNVGQTAGGNAIPGTVEDMTYTTMTVDGCEIKDTVIDLTEGNANGIRMQGGLLGYGWCNVDAEISNIKVTGATKLYSRGSVGGFVTFISGQCKVHHISIESLEMKSVYGNNIHYSSFLFGNGRYAYISLDQETYRLNMDGSVSATGYTNFDEIVGINLTVSDSNNPNANTTVDIGYNAGHNNMLTLETGYNGGGILNILNPDFKSFNLADYSGEETYNSYKNQIIDKVNKCTRYYYNLFVGDETDWMIGGTSTEVIIDSPEKFMTWHVSNYANVYIRRFFKKYYSNTTNYIGISNVQITADLDLNGYSYYPTHITNKTIQGNGHKITLYGEEISDLEKSLFENTTNKVNRNNEYLSTTTQHYMMHTALFNNMNGGSVSGLVLSGSVANNDVYTGALAGGCLMGTVSISDITIDNLRISHYGTSRICGLLISRIGTVGWTKPDNPHAITLSAQVTLDNIETINYESSTKPVASALIGSVGSQKATDVQVYFKNMRIADKASENVFANASLIGYYNYTNDIEENNCHCLYTFNYADTVKEETDTETGITTTVINSNVTYGKELAEGANYNDYLLTSIETIFGTGAENPLDEAIKAAATYLPYVKDVKKIYVNPRNGNILEGCGTYEDPYIIDNPKQLLTLYCYLTGKSSYYTMLEGFGESVWKVNKVGGNGTGYECVVQADGSTVTVHETVAFALDSEGRVIEEFPSVEDLCTAYYRISADINMETKSDLNDLILIQEFNGLGTQEHPFSGVLVGSKLSTNQYTTIILPRIASNTTAQLNYGLLQYMQGAVVKDLNIITPQVEDGFISVTESAGGIAAVVLGGDNIIDNVTTAVKLQAGGAGVYTASITTLGGYVGVIRNGSVILRNICGKNVVAECEFRHCQILNNKTQVINPYKYRDSDAAADSTKLISSDYVGLLVGKVEDGYLLYEYNTTENVFADEEKKVLSKTDFVVSANTSLALANGFDIINGYALDKATEHEKIGVTADPEGNLTVNIKNAANLEIIALALNSDALSVSYNVADDRTKGTDVFGYDYAARCRKMQYSGIGSKCVDGNLAKMYDDGKKADQSNIFMFPYLLYKYVKFEEIGNTDEANYNAYIANAIEKTTNADGTIVYVSKFNKAEDNVRKYTTTYTLDASATTVFDVSDYGISFRGLGALYSTGKSDFRANFNGNGKSVKIFMERNFDNAKDFSTGMFNALTYDTRIGGTVTNRTEIVDSTNAVPLKIENLKIVDSIFRNTTSVGSFTGAIAGTVEGVWEFNHIELAITEDYSTKTETEQPVVIGNKYVGGLIGSINTIKWHPNAYVDELHTSSNMIRMQECKLNGLAIGNEVQVLAEDGAQAVGGLIGGAGRYFADTNTNRECYLGTVELVDCSVRNTMIALGNTGNAGGFVGEAGFRNVNGNYSMAGVVSITNTENYNTYNIDTVTIKNEVTSSSAAESSMGGVIGKVQMLNHSSRNPAYEILTVSGYGEDKKFTINNLKLLPSQSTAGLTYSDAVLNGIGGVIGLNRTRTTNILNLCVQDSMIGSSDTSNLSTGGVMGYYCLVQGGGIASTVNNTLRHIEIVNTKILSKAGMVGGYIGYTKSESNTIENGKVRNCIIESKEQSVGGLIGMLYPNNTGNTTKIVNQRITATIIKTLDTSTDSNNTIAAGGIIGNAFKCKSTIDIGNIYVGQGCDIRGSKGGGGIFGIYGTEINLLVSDWIGVGADYDADTDVWSEDAVYNNISGRIAGGITGCDDSATERSIAATLYVAKNRIYSYDRMKNATGRCGSGGLVGYKNGSSGQVIYDDLRIKNNVIITSGRCGDAADCYGAGNDHDMPAAGGIYGRMETSSSNATFCSSVSLVNNSIGFYDISTLEDENTKYEQYKNLTIYSDDVKLFYYNTVDKKAEAVNWKQVSIHELNVGQYSIGIGTYIGYYVYGRQMNFMCADIVFDENVGSIPAVDVGNISYSTALAPYGTSYPYGYRTYCHFIDLQKATTTNSIIDSEIMTEADEDENFYEHLGTLIQEYKNIKNSNANVDTNDSTAVKAETYKFLMSKRLNMYLTGQDKNYFLCDGEPNYYDLTCKLTEYNQVPIIELDGHDVQHLADYVALLLTNGGGATPKGTMAVMKNNGVFKVSCVDAVVTPEGKIIKNNNIYGTGENKSKPSVTTTDNYSLTLKNCPYDERLTNDQGTYYTITLVKYRYGIKKTDGSYYYETIFIPIYVKEKVTLHSTVRILSGEDYSYNRAKEEGKNGDLVISHGSNYTIFTEFVYDNIRIKDAFKNYVVDKTLVYSSGQEGLPIGTKLTLVDAQDGKVYYYTVADENINQIPFSSFKYQGISYNERTIGAGTNGITLTANNYKTFDGVTINGTAGIQRYFIYVQPPDNDHNVGFEFAVQAKPVDLNKNDVSGYFKTYLNESLYMDFIPGPQISFAGISLNTSSGIYSGTENVTMIEGVISQDKTIEVDATIDISVDDTSSPYWTKKENTIDSTNNNKYFDIAISLMDDETGEEVLWPEGTNIILNHGSPQTINGSNIYLYKDSGKVFSFDTLDRDMNGLNPWYHYSFFDADNQEWVSKWITSDDNVNYYYYRNQTEKTEIQNVSIDELEMVSNHTHITFDFSLADVDDYADKKYYVVLRLYRTMDPTYPMEEKITSIGNRHAEYKEEVTGVMNKYLGAAVSVEDTMSLGISLYQNFDTEEQIPFVNKFDFTNLINARNAVKAEKDIAECAEDVYMVTYRLQKKNRDGKYETISWENSPFHLWQVLPDQSKQPLTSKHMENHQVYMELKRFTADEIKTGVDNIPYMTAWDLEVTADLDALKAAEEKWSNYKVLVTYLPYDSTDPNAYPVTDETATLSDYFIFTVAMLKTDM